MADLLESRELQPKDILQFVETRPERAFEVLRQIIDMPEYGNAQLAQAVAAQAWNGTATTVSSGLFGIAANSNAQAQLGAWNNG